MQRLIRTQLRGKLILAFVAVLTIPTLMNIIYDIFITRENTLELARSDSLATVTVQAARAEEYLLRSRDETLFLAHTPSLIDYVNAGNEQEQTERFPNVQDGFLSFAINLPHYNQLYLFDIEGEAVTGIHVVDGEPELAIEQEAVEEMRPFAQQGLDIPDGQVRLSLLTGENRSALLYVIPVYNTVGEISGVIVADLNLTPLGQYFQLESGTNLVLEQNGEHLGASGENYFENNPEEAKEIQGKQSGVLAGSKDQPEILTSFAMINVPGTSINWYLLYQQNMDELVPSIPGEALRALAFGVISLITGILIASVLTDSIVRPLRGLVESVARRGREADDDRSDDEIGQLATAFQSISSELANAYHDLEDRITLQKIAESDRARLHEAQRAITREKEEALALLNSFFLKTSVGMAFLDEDARFVRLNQGLADILGMPIEAPLGKSPGELVTNVNGESGEDKASALRLDRLTRQVIETQVGLREEVGVRVKTNNGDEETYLDITIEPLFDVEGHLRGVTCAALDITAHKKAQEILRESEERFRSMADSAPVLIWMSGTDKLFHYVNKVWIDFTGQTFSEQLGTGWLEGILPDDREYCRTNYSEAFDARQDFRLEYRRRRHDGEYRWMINNGTPRFLSNGTFLGYIGSCLDITERYQAEQNLKVFAEKLGRSNQELQNFAYIASHDLQEPLRKVQAFGDRLKLKYAEALGDQGQDYLNRMQNAASRMQNLIQDLLTYSRVTSQSRPFVRVNLDEVVTQVLGDLEVQIERKDAEISVEKLATIDADPLQLGQLIQNLLSNALKYQNEGVVPVIRVWGESVNYDPNITPARQSLFRLFVQDNGIGFDEKYLDRIFGFFQRLHGRQEYEGTGMGLAICRKIVERHNGTITATSHVDQGSTFIVTLPVHQKKNNNEKDAYEQPIQGTIHHTDGR